MPLHAGGTGLQGTIRKRRERPKHAKRHFRLHKQGWIDPFPWIPGTGPEKRIFEALVKRRIYFRFHAGTPDTVKLADPFVKDYDIDFTLPEYGVIIDPFDPFHHSEAASGPRDKLKLALFSAAGWSEYHPWYVGPGVFVLDEPQLVLGRWKGNINTTATRYEPIYGQHGLITGYKRVLSGRTAITTPQYRTEGKWVPVYGEHGLIVGRKWVSRRVKVGPGILKYAPSGGSREGLHAKVYGAYELLALLPNVARGPRFKLTDPEDIAAKRTTGYLIGSHLGAGAGAVGAANRKRRRIKSVDLRRRAV